MSKLKYLWTSLCPFIFFVNLLHSPCVWLFDIWHLFDHLTSFWQFDIFLTFWHLFKLKPPQPITWLFLVALSHEWSDLSSHHSALKFGWTKMCFMPFWATSFWPPDKGKIFWHQIWLDICSDPKKFFSKMFPPPKKKFTPEFTGTSPRDVSSW